MKIIINGILGKMGRSIVSIALNEGFQIIAGLDRNETSLENIPVFDNINELPADADCIVDFSSPDGFMNVTKFCDERRIPLVSGTTGLDDNQKESLKKLSERIPLFYSTNMSIAVGVVGKLASDASALLPDADVEIIEYHHRNKADAPSGTALTIARKIAAVKGLEEKDFIFGRQGKTGIRPEKQIGIHAVRGGEIVGEHQVLFALPDEELIIIHRARDRKIFARGALIAVKWLAKKKPGLYSIENILMNE